MVGRSACESGTAALRPNAHTWFSNSNPHRLKRIQPSPRRRRTTTDAHAKSQRQRTGNTSMHIGIMLPATSQHSNITMLPATEQTRPDQRATPINNNNLELQSCVETRRESQSTTSTSTSCSSSTRTTRMQHGFGLYLVGASLFWADLYQPCWPGPPPAPERTNSTVRTRIAGRGTCPQRQARVYNTSTAFCTRVLHIHCTSKVPSDPKAPRFFEKANLQFAPWPP